MDWRLSRDINGHDVKTAHQMGWSGVKNGVLLGLVSGKFDVLVTVDRNLAFQNVVANLSFAVIVLHAHTNRIDELRPLVPEPVRAIEQSKPGELRRIQS